MDSNKKKKSSALGWLIILLLLLWKLLDTDTSVSSSTASVTKPAKIKTDFTASQGATAVSAVSSLETNASTSTKDEDLVL